MRPSEKLIKLIRIMRVCAAFCGADMIDVNYKVTIASWSVVTCIVIYFISSAYTINLKISENWSIVLESFCMVGSVLQGSSKLLSCVIYHNTFRAQHAFLTSVYVQYEFKNEEYSLVVNRCVSRLRVVILSAACLYVVAFTALLCAPLFIYAFTGRLVLAVQFYLPFIDPDTVLGYFITIGVQSICLFYAGVGNFALDMVMLLYFAHSTLLADILKLKAEELNELAIDSGSRKTMDKLIDVIEWHQTYSNFIEVNDKIFFWINFTEITTSGISIALTLVSMFTSDWLGAYAYLGLAFLVLYLYCGIGTLVENANDRIVEEIYAIHWYLLKISQQKDVQYMLMKAQSPKQITVGGIVPLSVSTGLQVTKTVYSFFMMLLNFID